MPKNQRSDGNILARYERMSEAQNLSNAMGDSASARRSGRNVDRLAEIANARGLDLSELDIEDFGDAEDLIPSRTRGAISTLTNMKRRQIGGRGGEWQDKQRGDSTLNRFKTRMHKNVESEAVRRYQDEYMAPLDDIAQRNEQRSQEDMISGGEAQAMRSRIAASVRQSEASRMQRIASAMGYGNAANSPAAAALAQESAIEADRTLVNTLRDTSLRISEMNEHERRLNTQLASQLAATRMAITTGDSSSLASMSGDIANVIDAFYSRERAWELQEKAIDAASQGPTHAETFATYASGVGDLAEGGAAIAGAGG